MLVRVVLAMLVCLAQGQLLAGFVSIDEFTNAAESDGVGRRTFAGDVTVEDDAASLVGGVAWLGEVAAITYDFLPAPLVVKPKFVLKLKNNQTTFEESGILRATINGGPPLERELFAVRDYEIVVFDFIPLLPASETIREFRVDWLRPDQATGARELLIDSIEVQDVPEPRSMSLIGSAAGIAAIMRRRKKKGMSDSGRDFGQSTDEAIRRRKILNGARQCGDIVSGDDGYRIYWPDRLNGGLDAFALRTIADELDRLNKEWDDSVRAYFADRSRSK